MLPKKTVYLAGKVNGRKRHVVAGLEDDANFISSDGSKHSEHGWGCSHYGFDSADLMTAVRDDCAGSIAASDYLVAYLENPTSFGSIAEIAYASGRGIQSFVFILNLPNPLQEDDSPPLMTVMFDAYWLVSYFPHVSTILVQGEDEAAREIRRLVRRQSYHEYLNSEAWNERRKAALAAAGYRCQLCNAAKPLQVHHRTYERIGLELPDDLIALCGECHEKFHDVKRTA